MQRSQIQDKEELAKLLENVATDVRRGGPTFIAVTVVSRNAIEPDKPLVLVCNLGRGASPEVVAGAFADLASDAISIGALVPD